MSLWSITDPVWRESEGVFTKGENSFLDGVSVSADMFFSVPQVRVCFLLAAKPDSGRTVVLTSRTSPAPSRRAALPQGGRWRADGSGRRGLLPV